MKIIKEYRDAEYDEFMEGASRRLSPEYSSHYLSECPGCGWRDWRYSNNEGRVVRVTELNKDFDPCQRCMTAQIREPEVFAWVCGVADKLRRDLESKT